MNKEYKEKARAYLLENPAYDYSLFSYEVMDAVNDFNSFCTGNRNIRKFIGEVAYNNLGISAKAEAHYRNGRYDSITIEAGAYGFDARRIEKRAELESFRDCLENIIPANAVKYGGK